MDIRDTGKAIGNLRKKAGLTQQQLAVALNVSDKAVSKWERGLSCPDISLLPKISILLDTDIESLLYGHHFQHKAHWCGILILDKNSEITPIRMIYNKPLVYFWLSYFMLIGIKDILIINDYGDVEMLLGDGRQYGITLQYNINWNNFAKGRSVALYQGSTVLYGMDLTKICQRAMANSIGASILAICGGSELAEVELFFDYKHKVIADKSARASLDHYYQGPFLFCPVEIWEKTDAFGKGYEEVLYQLKKGSNLYVELIGRGMQRFSVTTEDELLDFAQFVKVTQRNSREQIACLEEIAWRRGLISTNQLRDLIEQQNNRRLKDYLNKLSKGGNHQ